MPPTRKMVKLLRDAGFLPGNTMGSHTKWIKGTLTISVPDGHRVISSGVVRKITLAIEESKK